MKDKFKKIINNIKYALKKDNKKVLLVLVILVLTILSSVTLIAYSFYVNRSTNLIIAGVASIDKSDVKIKVYREDKNSSGVGLGTYSLSYYVPNETSYSYNSSKTSCDTGITINKYENRIFYVNATKKGKCEVYFDAIDGYIDDYEVNLFVQQEMGNTDDKNYEQMGQLPLYETGYYYTVNTSKTSCNPSATVSIVGRKINVLTSEQTVCNVYVDKNEDSTSPTITNLTVSGTSVTATFTDNIDVSMYGFSSSADEQPTEWKYISGTSYSLDVTIEEEGTYYLWVKDSAGNKATKEFAISLGTSFATLMTPNNTDIFEENGIRYEGADPNNYICLDNQKEGTCSNTSLLFRIIGLFNEEYSSDGTNSSGTKKLLKVLDTNTINRNWDANGTNNWPNSTLYGAFNSGTGITDDYVTTLSSTTVSNSKLSNSIVKAKWHLGGAGASNASSLTTSQMYTEERNTSAVYGSNSSTVYAKVGLMYPSDYGYATVGGNTTNKSTCRNTALYIWDKSSYSDCKNNDWIFKSASFINSGEWLISTNTSRFYMSVFLDSNGMVNLTGVEPDTNYSVRPTFYLDSDALKIIGGNGSQTNPYHIS